MNTTNSWVIEYSHSMDAFHIGRTGDMIRRNIGSLGNDHMTDYICMGIFPSHEKAVDAVFEFRRNRVPGFSLSLQI